MKRRTWPWLLAALAALGWLARPASVPHVVQTEPRPARQHPDLTGAVLPPNLAPPNFVVDEPGQRFVARFSGAHGRAVTVRGRRGAVVIPPRSWRALLAANAGGALTVEVYARSGGGWRGFAPTTWAVAREPVDRYLVYRYFRPAYNSQTFLGLYQRDLSSYQVRPLVNTGDTRVRCVNCHTFLDRQPDRMVFHVRGGQPSMVVAGGGRAQVVDARAGGQPNPAAYSSWHPSGRWVAFAWNTVFQFFHTAGPMTKEAMDGSSGLGLYNVDTGQTTYPAALNPPGRLPTFPTWSPDGRTLYFAAAERNWPAKTDWPIAAAPAVRYDLLAADFDAARATWSRPRVVLSAQRLGGSLTQPRVSPDGRWMLFCRCDQGSFPVFQMHSDLWLLDLAQPGAQPRQLWPADHSWRDSWHSWSGDSRWIVFSRKSDNGRVARPYLAHLTADGQAARPVALPQRDPTFYDRCLNTFNVPEFVTGPVAVDRAALRRAADSTMR